MLTSAGIQKLLATAFQGAAVPTLYAGLCDCVFDPAMQATDLSEPVLGTGGYARQALTPNTTNWPTSGNVNGLYYVESKSIVFPATGPYSKVVSRLFLTTSATATTGDIFALGGVLLAPILINAATPAVSRTFKYRMYMR